MEFINKDLTIRLLLGEGYAFHNVLIQRTMSMDLSAISSNIVLFSILLLWKSLMICGVTGEKPTQILAESCPINAFDIDPQNPAVSFGEWTCSVMFQF